MATSFTFPDENVFRDAVEHVSANRNQLRAAGLRAEEQFMNAVQFSVLFNYDLRVLLSEVTSGDTSWRTGLFARHMLLIMYEAADDFTKILGTDLRNILKNWGAEDGFLARLNELHRELTKFRRENQARFGQVRNTIGAHRDHDAAAQLAMINSIDVKHVIDQSMRFINWLTALHTYCTSVLNWSAQRDASRPAG